jgi:hypothetical protein
MYVAYYEVKSNGQALLRLYITCVQLDGGCPGIKSKAKGEGEGRMDVENVSNLF